MFPEVPTFSCLNLDVLRTLRTTAKTCCKIVWGERRFPLVNKEVQDQVNKELEQRKRILKKLEKEKKPLDYKLQFTPLEYVSRQMRVKWFQEYLIEH
jgi:hypothetical protein